MNVWIAEARYHDHARAIDHLPTADAKIRTDRDDFFTFYEHVAVREVGDRRVHGDNGATLKQDTLRALGIRRWAVGCEGSRQACGCKCTRGHTCCGRSE